MNADQANAIIDTITGLPRDHTDRLNIADSVGRAVIEAVEFLRGVE